MKKVITQIKQIYELVLGWWRKIWAPVRKFWNGVKKVLGKIWQPWKKLKNRWKFVLIIIIAVLWWRWYSTEQKEKIYQANRQVMPVVREDLVKEAIRTGQVELQGVIEVKPPLSGVITELLVQNGQVVSEGQELFSVKSDASEAEKAAAWSSYLAAKNAYEEAQITTFDSEWASFEGAKGSVIAAEQAVEQFENDFPDKKDANNKEYQAVLQNLKVARHNVDMAVQMPNRVQAQLDQARANYNAALAAYNASRDGVYKSPINGRVENLGVNQGERVIADVGDKAGTPLFLIVPDGKKTISMQIGPNDAMLLAVGQLAVVKSDTAEEATFGASIARIDKVGKAGAETGLTYRAWLEVDDPEDLLLLGVPVEITIQTGAAPGALTVPTAAVKEGMITIVDESGNELEMRTVTEGLKVMGRTEIVSGVNDGEFVLIDSNPIE